MPFLMPVKNCVISYSDASATGCAALITLKQGQEPLTTNYRFSETQIAASSTYRELFAVYHGLKNAKHLLKYTGIRWFTDNKNVVHIVSSMKLALHRLALQIFELTRKYKICLVMTWIPRSLNDQADLASRVIDYDDWYVSAKFFNFIQDKLGKMDIDRFADEHNHNLPRFNTRFLTEGSEAIDAFTQNWALAKNWLVPPTILIPRALKYLKECSAMGILIVPVWHGSSFWPFIYDFLKNEQAVLKGQLTLGNIFSQGKNKNTIFGSTEYKSHTLVLLIDYRPVG